MRVGSFRKQNASRPREARDLALRSKTSRKGSDGFRSSKFFQTSLQARSGGPRTAGSRLDPNRSVSPITLNNNEESRTRYGLTPGHSLASSRLQSTFQSLDSQRQC